MKSIFSEANLNMSEKTKKSVEESNEYGRVKDSFQYQPTHFMRAHSKYNDPSDSSTAIWGVVFEPDLENKNKTTQLVKSRFPPLCSG